MSASIYSTTKGLLHQLFSTGFFQLKFIDDLLYQTTQTSRAELRGNLLRETAASGFTLLQETRPKIVCLCFFPFLPQFKAIQRDR